jgi:hypothetical protein
VKVEKDFQADKDQDHTCGFIDEYLEEASHQYFQNYESTHVTDYECWISEHNAHSSISMNNSILISV